jgi:hypothetical protein
MSGNEIAPMIFCGFLLVVGLIRWRRYKKQDREHERAMNQPRPREMNKTEF